MFRITRLLGTSLVLALLCGAYPSSALAQNRQGFWFGLGGGFGSANATCDDCDSSKRESSGAAYIKGGWTLNERVLIGAEFNLWSKKYAIERGVEATVNMYNASGTLTFYPSASGGFFVKGGGGVALVDTDVKASGSTVTVDLGKGPGLIAGAGYDIPLGGRIALTPAVNFWYGSLGDLKILGNTFTSNWKQNVLDITIGFTFP